ncbi:MAG: hypothetical protein IK990_19735 [Ruminiclostridium sp.]|nr:hypothetical protein [Ruminiclostridium sp.]
MAIEIGTAIDEAEGDGTDAVRFLEEYCETAYELSQRSDESKSCKTLDKILIKAENSVKSDIKSRLEIAIMPYKACMWDSLESIWKAADDDPDCDVYVVPIPYYARNPDHSFGRYHYEGKDFPEYVPIIDHESYDLEKRRPDIIYIHNPYDGDNYVTSVDPRYYSYELKKYTDMLVYCPYYFFAKVYSESFIICPGVLNSNKVIVQSNRIKDLYIDVYTKELKVPEHKIKEEIVPLGSPKIDAIINAKKENYPIPDKWRRIIIDRRKIVLYNTSISALLKNSEKYLEKIEKTLDYFETADDYVLWWRPHPLLESTITSMMPTLSGTFNKLKRMYLAKSIGIYDDTPDSTRAVINSDIYYGDRRSTLSYSFVFTDRPVVFTDKDELVTTGNFEFDRINNSLSEEERKHFFENNNIDGHAGEKIHNYIKECVSSQKMSLNYN